VLADVPAITDQWSFLGPQVLERYGLTTAGVLALPAVEVARLIRAIAAPYVEAIGPELPDIGTVHDDMITVRRV